MKKFWIDISVGDYLEILQKPKLTRLQIANYSVAFNEFSPLQLDDDYAKDAGFNSVVAPNLIALGLVQEIISNFAQNINLVSLNATFYKLIWPHDGLITKGLITQRYQKNEEFRAGISVWSENQAGEVVMKGQADILMFKNAEEQKNSMLLAPKISYETAILFENKYSKWFEEINKPATALV